MMKAKKYLWCEKCKTFPDEIIEIYDEVKEKRKWDGDCYELIDSDFDEHFVETICPICKTTLIEKEG